MDQIPTGAETHRDTAWLHAYADGELTPVEQDAVARHVAECADCRGRVEALRGFFAELEGVPESPLTRDLAPGVLAALSRPPAALQSERPSDPVGTAADAPAVGLSGAWRWLVAAQIAVALVIAACVAWVALASPAASGAAGPAPQADVEWLSDLLDRLAEADAAAGARAEALADSAATAWRPELAWAEIEHELAAMPAEAWAVFLAGIALATAMVNGTAARAVLVDRGRGRPRQV